MITPPVSATPSGSSNQAEFRRIQAQIEQIDQQLDVVVEEYNASTLSFRKTQKELQSCSAALRAVEEESAGRRAAMNARLINIYQKGPLSYLDLLLNTKNLDQFLYCVGLVERLAMKDAKIIEELRESNREMAEKRAVLQAKEKRQKETMSQIKAKKDKIASQLKERNILLAKVKDEIEKERREEARRQVKIVKTLKVSMRSKPGIAVSRGGSRSSVVGIAMNELGKPYAWGGSGPNSFDCSGFTSYVYGQLGVSLPHSSRAQYSCGQHVNRDELQAGDLVFFARGGTISHVGIYVGGGNFIHAPRTGDVVKVSNLGSHGGYVGAVRP